MLSASYISKGRLEHPVMFTHGTRRTQRRKMDSWAVERETHYTGAGLIDLPINYALQLPQKISCSRILQIVTRNITTTRLCDLQNTVSSTPHNRAPGTRPAQYCMQAPQFVASGRVLARQPHDGSKKKVNKTCRSGPGTRVHMCTRTHT